MPTPNEIGTLRARPNGESLFVGSSSGVFFINTVRRAFSQAAATTYQRQRTTNDAHTSANFASLPSPEDCIIGSETQPSQDWLNARRAAAETTPTQPERESRRRSNLEDLGTLPDHAVAKELLITYFRTWHPLLPFLHGPTCLGDLEDAYAAGQPRKPKSLSTAIIFQSLFSIAKLDRPDLPSLGASQFQSEEQLMLALSTVSLKCDLASIQALLAAELYFVAIMDVRAASSVGGLVLRSMFKSGLHRCPVRYTHLTSSDHDMRKRMFWSAYCLDRYVSQTLGHPLGIQDSDFDVCAPGDIDLHQPVRTANEADEGTSPEETVLHLPANHPSRQYASPRHGPTSPENSQRERSVQPDDQERSPAWPVNNRNGTSQLRQENQVAQAQFVRYSKLIGRMMETFHKSIHVRLASRQNILFLKADIDAWGNDLSQPLPGPTVGDQVQPASLNQDVFFWVARQQLLLLVNRPLLSLDPESAEFRYAAQICIGAARSIIRTLDTHMISGGKLFWPGSIHSVWMSGLVMAFTCQLKLQSTINAVNDITTSLKILKVMAKRWQMAQNCHEVLSMLLDNIQNPETPETVSARGDLAESRHSRSTDQENARGEKRQRENNASAGNMQQRSKFPRYTAQPSHTSSATSVPDNPLMTTSGHGLYDSNQHFDPRAGAYQSNDQFTGGDVLSSQGGGNLYGSLVHPEQTIYNANNYALEINPQNIAMNAPYVPTPGFGPSTFYDVFDGAAWGPLLDLVEDRR
ncbi:fungal-specific transcription factor domain-containing protein [Boeremia exigua]|uniref:fungal-specific transcription factor domain-containing protein n=1 Tax=Boeremia exigua TaxID=749465 RepID=UPI001E8CA7D8|nr:fungal-specific transcription factor domain-containing protein [Boeremia exigua]KAH6621987.1 fungal-specific transcription factor domain-containing protein [Boeremia exigua]